MPPNTELLTTSVHLTGRRFVAGKSREAQELHRTGAVSARKMRPCHEQSGPLYFGQISDGI
jgi:hypothetical protein